MEQNPSREVNRYWDAREILKLLLYFIFPKLINGEIKNTSLSDMVEKPQMIAGIEDIQYMTICLCSLYTEHFLSC
jgi:hypothetical protein